MRVEECVFCRCSPVCPKAKEITTANLTIARRESRIKRTMGERQWGTHGPGRQTRCMSSTGDRWGIGKQARQRIRHNNGICAIFIDHSNLTHSSIHMVSISASLSARAVTGDFQFHVEACAMPHMSLCRRLLNQLDDVDQSFKRTRLARHLRDASIEFPFSVSKSESESDISSISSLSGLTNLSSLSVVQH